MNQQLINRKLRTAYILLSVVALVWLAYHNVELRYYRERRVGADANRIAVPLTQTPFYIERALELYEPGDPSGTIEWLVSAERDLGVAEAAVAGYNLAFHRRLTGPRCGLPLEVPLSTYASEISTTRRELQRTGELTPENEALLENVAADFRALQAAFPESMLERARCDELQAALADVEPKLKTDAIVQLLTGFTQ